MLNRFLLFKQAASTAAKAVANKTSKRKLYTEHIYHYPNKWINDNKWTGHFCYRETFIAPPWQAYHTKVGDFGFRFFWFYMFMMFFHDPGALFGHWHQPDPKIWSDAELGIPPDEYGSYEQWVEKQVQDGKIHLNEQVDTN